MGFKISGLEKLQKELEEAQRAFAALDGQITTLNFNPVDPESVQEAIRQMEAAIDAKAAPYKNNQLVQKIIPSLKDRYRQAILEKSAEHQA